MYETVSVLLKTLGAAISAAFGMLALMTEFKDDSKRVTHAGRAALYGILGGFLLTTITSAIDYQKERTTQKDTARKTLESVSRSELTVQNLDRLLQPLGDLRVSFSFFVSESSRTKKYLDVVQKNSLAAIHKSRLNHQGMTDVGVTAIPDGDGQGGIDWSHISYVSIDGGSPALPRFMGTNGDIGLRNRGFEMLFFSKKKDPHVFAEMQQQSWPQPDLRIRVFAASYGTGSQLETDFYPNDKRTYLKSDDLPAIVEEDNGVITSVRDLPGCLLLVHQFDTGNDIYLQKLDLTVAKGKSYTFTNTQCGNAISRDGTAIMACTLGEPKAGLVRDTKAK